MDRWYYTLLHYKIFILFIVSFGILNFIPYIFSMRSFKFFSGRSTGLDLDSSPSWIYDTNVNLDGLDHFIVTEQYRGIYDFLNHFPDNFVVVVKSITCNGRTHTGTSEYPDGWGFDVTSDLLTIEHYRFTENDDTYDDTNHS